MKFKNSYIVLMFIAALIMFWKTNNLYLQLILKIIGVVIFFYFMMKLSSKTPPKNDDNV
jgi:uncharacterized membrane protein YbaN (DUF454 family)